MSYYNIIAQTTESTVVTEYKSNSTRADAYQSEAELEKEFIRLLTEKVLKHIVGADYIVFLPITLNKTLTHNGI